MTPFVTAHADFYRIDTALTAPQLRTEDYTLRVIGMVDNELALSYDDLLGRRMIERDITLTCVSNEVGGRYVGNARWLGARLADVLREAGVRRGADQVVGRSVDGFECGFPIETAMDGRDALIAIAMNGEPLPIEHGFPARLIVPGLSCRMDHTDRVDTFPGLKLDAHHFAASPLRAWWIGGGRRSAAFRQPGDGAVVQAA